MEPNLQLDDNEVEPVEDASQYRRLLGRLMYLTISWPDIIYAVNKLSQFMANPRSTHLKALHHVLQYLKTAPGQGLFFPAETNTIVNYCICCFGLGKSQGHKEVPN